MLMAMSGVEMGEEGGLVFLVLTALLLSLISNFFPQNKEGGPGPWPQAQICHWSLI